MAEYTAIVLYYRAGPKIWDTVRCLRDQSVPPHKILVVDNGSDDGISSSIPPDVEVTWVESARNLGYSAGMWLGTQQVPATSEWILYTTHEVLLSHDCVETMLAEGTKRAAAQVGPQTRTLGTEDTWSSGGGFNWRGNSVHIRAAGSQPREVGWLEGCCHLVRRDLARFETFHNDYFLYWDDVEISHQLSTFGQIVVVPSAICWQSTNGQPAYFGARNRILFWKRRRRWGLVLVSVMELLAKSVIRGARPRDRGESAAILNGVADGLRGRLSPAEAGASDA